MTGAIQEQIEIRARLEGVQSVTEALDRLVKVRERDEAAVERIAKAYDVEYRAARQLCRRADAARSNARSVESDHPMIDLLKKALADLNGVENIASQVNQLIEEWALAVAGSSGNERTHAAVWLRNEMIKDLSKVEAFHSKDFAAIAHVLVDLFNKRIAEMERRSVGHA